MSYIVLRAARRASSLFCASEAVSDGARPVLGKGRSGLREMQAVHSCSALSVLPLPLASLPASWRFAATGAAVGPGRIHFPHAKEEQGHSCKKMISP